MLERLGQLLAESEDDLMHRVLTYAKVQGYTKYTSTLLEAWRVSIAGITASIIDALGRYDGPPELGPDEDFTQDPVGAFGRLEAQRHRVRGVTLPMFMGLMKYYRQVYIDLVDGADLDAERRDLYRRFLHRCFDRLEIGYCTEWSSLSEGRRVAELQATNRRMTNEKNRYLTIFESLHAPVVLLDTEDRIVNLNQAAAGLFSAMDTPGAIYYQRASVADDGSGQKLKLPWLTERLTAMSDRLRDVTFEQSVDTHRGRRVFLVKMKRMLDVSEKFSGTVIILDDITERREATEALRESNVRLERALDDLRTTQEQMLQQERLAAIGQLAAGIAHEFNNMMAPVVLYTDVLRRSDELSPKQEAILDIIGEEGRRAADLTQQILDFSRRSMLERQRLDLVQQVERVAHLLRPSMRADIKMRLRTPAHSVWVQADPTRLQQALMNLALNARDAMPQGGELTFDVSLEDGSAPVARVSVSDTGTGIPPEVRDHLFEPFFTTKPVGEGTGLGLAQVYGIVKQHDGEIDVATEVGVGSSFTITLPALSGWATAQARVPAAAPAFVQGRGETVLVVEDDPTVQAALVAALENLNYRVLTARNGRDALALLGVDEAAGCRDRQPAGRDGTDVALVLSDLVMPGGDGRELVRRLSAAAAGVPVVGLTGYPIDDTGVPTDIDGVRAWLQKPIDLQQLSEVVAQALASSARA